MDRGYHVGIQTGRIDYYGKVRTTTNYYQRMAIWRGEGFDPVRDVFGGAFGTFDLRTGEDYYYQVATLSVPPSPSRR